MQYARLGKSNMKVSKLALGTMNFGIRTPEDEAFRIMDRALELGITLFDTANVYGISSLNPAGQGTTERVIGRWLAQGGDRRECIVLATKVAGPMDAHIYGPNDARGYSGFKLRRQLDESLTRLQTDHVDLYQLHLYDAQADMTDVLSTFDQLQAQGKAYYLGTCNHAGRHLAYWSAAAREQHVLGPVSEQHPYNLFERTAELEVIPATQELDLGLIAFRPLCAGKLSGAAHAAAGGRREKALASLTDTERAQIAAFHELCTDLGEAEADVATAWVLANPAVTTLLLGPRTLEQLEASVCAAEIELTDDVLARLDEIFPPLADRSATVAASRR